MSLSKINTSAWLEDLRKRCDDGDLPVYIPEEKLVESSEWPSDWPQEFITLSLELGLKRYLRELAEIATNDLPQNAYFRYTLMAWRTRQKTQDGAILYGGEGAGKSVTALAICLQEMRNGKGFDFLDAGEFADLWALQNRNRISMLKTTGLLVIDEIGDCLDIKGPAFGLLKRTINARYRNDLPTVLATTQDEEDLRIAIGPEIVDRFPSGLRIKTESFTGRK